MFLPTRTGRTNLHQHNSSRDSNRVHRSGYGGSPGAAPTWPDAAQDERIATYPTGMAIIRAAMGGLTACREMDLRRCQEELSKRAFVAARSALPILELPNLR